MIKKSMLCLALLSITLSGYTDYRDSLNPYAKYFNYEDFIEVTYDKEINNNIFYHYHVKNIGNVPIGRLELAYKAGQGGCQAPPQNIVTLIASLPEWIVRLERQEENPNKCIIADTPNNDYPLEPGKTLTITVELKKDDPVFENLGWEAVFTRAPTRLSGPAKKASDPLEEDAF